MSEPSHSTRTTGWPLRAMAVATLAATVIAACVSGCSAGSGSSSSTSSSTSAKTGGGTTTGATFTLPAQITTTPANADAAVSSNGASIDASTVSQGYVSVWATNSSRLKFQVMSGQMSYNYDLPGDGTPIVCPINMGNGSYTFRVMQNTSGNNYIEICSTTTDVMLASEFEPFLRPNVYCSFTDASACVTKARELTASSATQGDALAAICTYIVDNISYDSDKATSLASATGYVPSPDSTLASGKGICFDYASLGAAMLRSVGIPCKVVTGYVSPDSIYHAWIMVYVDGSWTGARFDVEQRTWSRVDLTFAAAGGPTKFVGDGKTYTDRYTY